MTEGVEIVAGGGCNVETATKKSANRDCLMACEMRLPPCVAYSYDTETKKCTTATGCDSVVYILKQTATTYMISKHHIIWLDSFSLWFNIFPQSSHSIFLILIFNLIKIIIGLGGLERKLFGKLLFWFLLLFSLSIQMHKTIWFSIESLVQTGNS